MAQAHALLAQNCPTVLFNGMGGIGKTSVAIKYVAHYGHEYQHLAWLTVQSGLLETFTRSETLLDALHIKQQVIDPITLFFKQMLVFPFKTGCHCERVQRAKQSAQFSQSASLLNNDCKGLADCFARFSRSQ